MAQVLSALVATIGLSPLVVRRLTRCTPASCRRHLTDGQHVLVRLPDSSIYERPLAVVTELHLSPLSPIILAPLAGRLDPSSPYAGSCGVVELPALSLLLCQIRSA